MQSDYLLVYGTLCSGFSNEWQKKLCSSSLHLGRVSVPGKLYNIGTYPGAKKSDSGSVFQCELYFIKNNKSTLFKILDEYEGEEYYRDLLEINFEGKKILSWIYWYKEKTEEKQLILSPSYSEFINRNF